jgi:hypothetical protein
MAENAEAAPFNPIANPKAARRRAEFQIFDRDFARRRAVVEPWTGLSRKSHQNLGFQLRRRVRIPAATQGASFSRRAAKGATA